MTAIIPMKRADMTLPSLPPLRTLEAALHMTTGHLVREITRPTAQAPQWTALEWRIAEAAAVIHGIGALLACKLQWRGPARWEQFLAGQKHHTRLRRQYIAKTLARLDDAMHQAGIAAVALKGSALYDIGLYAGQERPMGDIDLLVREEDSDAAARLLIALGYQEKASTERHRVFEPAGQDAGKAGFGEHIDNPLKIELHTRIAERLPVYITDITALEFPRQPRPGLNPYSSIAALMRHLLLHTSCNIRARALRAIQLHDIALLASRMNDGDWHELTRERDGVRGLWWALPPMALTERYYPGSVSPAALQAATIGCPRLLRRAVRRHTLADVSWSNLRVRAFPGIEWSHSLPEALQFMTSRIFPARRDLALLRQIPARRPYGEATQWYGLSHINRIARWVFSHPPRVQTIYPIKVALGIEPGAGSEQELLRP